MTDKLPEAVLTSGPYWDAKCPHCDAVNEMIEGMNEKPVPGVYECDECEKEFMLVEKKAPTQKSEPVSNAKSKMIIDAVTSTDEIWLKLLIEDTGQVDILNELTPEEAYDAAWDALTDAAMKKKCSEISLRTVETGDCMVQFCGDTHIVVIPKQGSKLAGTFTAQSTKPPSAGASEEAFDQAAKSAVAEFTRFWNTMTPMAKPEVIAKALEECDE